MENNEIKSLTEATPKELAEEIVRILDSKKAHGIKLLYVEDKTVLSDYFVICNGTSNTQIKALANEIEYQLELRGVNPLHTEGLNEASWIVLDYASVIVHVFSQETRNFYGLEKLWSSSEEVDISKLLTED